MTRAAALIAGIAIGMTLTGGASADVSLDSIGQQVATLEATQACQMVAPFSVQQLHGTTKYTLVATNSGAGTFAKPSSFVWVMTMRPSCAAQVTK